MEDTAGVVYGRLTAVKFLSREKRGDVWLYRCICGNFIERLKTLVKTGHTKSCGCLQKEAASEASRTHGMRQERIYTIWCSLKQRCDDENSSNYPRYGGRGIAYPLKWKTFEGFFEDMGKEYSHGLSIERLDNSKSYSKENCCWTTPTRQANNRRTNLLIEYKGETKSLADWCRELNLEYFKIWGRLNKYGWTVEEAFS